MWYLKFIIITFFFIDYFFTYYNTTKSLKLTQKQKAHILSIKSSITLFIISLYFNYKFISSNFNISEYITQLSKKELFLLELAIYNLISYFISDSTIGFFNYHNFLCSLSGYLHHSVYTIIAFFSLIHLHNYPLFFLFLLAELPTIFLSIGRYNKSFASNNIFGSTFFLTRIIYHLILTITFKDNPIFLILGMLSLSVHIYWFKNWIDKYYLTQPQPTTQKS